MTESSSLRSAAVLDGASTLRAVTVIMAAVVALTLLFGFGNVWTLANRLGVTPWVAPLVAPAVDLSVIGLLLATRYLALQKTGAEALRSARRLLVFSSLVTLALNVAEPILAGQYGKAAFDAVGPSLLIGWAEVAPPLLQAIGGSGGDGGSSSSTLVKLPAAPVVEAGAGTGLTAHADGGGVGGRAAWPAGEDLLNRARRVDERHRRDTGRPVSAETLRRRLHVGASRSRELVHLLRSDPAIES